MKFGNIHMVSHFTRRNLSFLISDEIKLAIARSRPVVALESTIVSHGMPYPENVSTALQVEERIRENGAIPATIGVINGEAKVGLNRDEIEQLGNGNQRRTIKISTRDLPYALGCGLSGGTTVAATMILAKKSNIPVFVTGGIGGVHRGAERTFDISSDLTELGRTPIAVVCAGVKSILDIEKTLEYLETQGVTVATCGENTDFPSFFTAKSGFHAPYYVQNEIDAAKIIHERNNLSLPNAILFAVPIPQDLDHGSAIEDAIKLALMEAEVQHIAGKNLTPFILDYVNKFTHGLSLNLNKKLILNNAEVGAKICVEYSKLIQNKSHISTTNNGVRKSDKKIVVIGATNIDYVMNIDEDISYIGESLKGNIRKLYGGVGRNIAYCITMLSDDQPLLYISAIGDNENAIATQESSRIANTSGIAVIPNAKTATHCSVMDKNGNYLYGIADMAIHDSIDYDLLSKFENETLNARCIVCDGNIPDEALSYLIKLSHDNSIPIWFEPTEPRKATKPFQSSEWKNLTYISPNYQELLSIFHAIQDEAIPVAESSKAMLDNSIVICKKLTEHIPFVLVTLGSDGVLLCCWKSFMSGIKHQSQVKAPGPNDTLLQHFSAIPVSAESIRNVSGAGDCLAGTVISGLMRGLDVCSSIHAGMASAVRSIDSDHPVPESINDRVFTEFKKTKTTIISTNA